MVSEPTMIMAVTLFRNALNTTVRPKKDQEFKWIALGDLENLDADPQTGRCVRSILRIWWTQ